VPTIAAGRAEASPSAGAGRLTAQALGVNTTSGDPNFTDAPVAGLLQQAGIGRVRYPGGGGADFFDWTTTRTALPWPQFMDQLAAIGAAPMVTVNYGELSQGPTAAAAWVANAHTFANYDSATAVWVLGNEEYGPWEFDQHPDPHTPQSFATNVRPYFESMHAVDPATRVGFPMTIAREVAGGTGTWVANPDLWNRTVLGQNADQVDFIDFHWYPIFGIPVLSNAEIFETVDRIPGALSYVRGVIADCGSHAPIVVSESNISQSEIVYNAQPVAALYAAATALTILSEGAQSYMWWQVHNSDNLDGDFGFLSNATGTPGPSATTLSAAVPRGSRALAVASADGFYYAHRFTIGSGAGQEARNITALPGSTVLAAPASRGTRNLKVAETSTLTTSGATTAYDQFFAPGTPVTIGSGATAERVTVEAVGTSAGQAALAAPAAAGDRSARIVGVGMGGQAIPVFMPTAFAPGATITIGTGAGAEQAQVAAVGTSSSLGTTTVAPISPRDRTIYVQNVANTNTGVANYVGDPITVDTGAAEEVRTIAAVGSSAAAPTTLSAALAAGDRTVALTSLTGVTVGHPLLIGSGASAELTAPVTAIGTTVTLGSPVRAAHSAGDAALDLGSGITLSSPLAGAHLAGIPTRDAGSGLVLAAPLRRAHPDGSVVTTPGTGIALSAPLAHGHDGGEVIVISAITFTPALDRSHAAGEAVAEAGLMEPPLDTPLPAYWGFVLAEKLAQPGAAVTELDSPLSTVRAYVSQLAGSVSLMLINTDDTAQVTVGLGGLSDGWSRNGRHQPSRRPPAPGGTRLETFTYSLEEPQIAEGSMSLALVERGIDLAPESITVLVAQIGGPLPRLTLTRRR
jgi:hypothetical protein